MKTTVYEGFERRRHGLNNVFTEAVIVARKI